MEEEYHFLKHYTDYLLCMTTTDNEDVALRIKDALLSKKLAACITILPLATSYFWWEGKVEKAREFLLLIKTKKEKVDEVRKEVLANHNYEIAEFLVLPIIDGSVHYLEWMNSVLGESGDR